jgi:hypothetical protein
VWSAVVPWTSTKGGPAPVFAKPMDVPSAEVTVYITSLLLQDNHLVII